jgi:hypothetical protein
MNFALKLVNEIRCIYVNRLMEKNLSIFCSLGYQWYRQTLCLSVICCIKYRCTCCKNYLEANALKHLKELGMILRKIPYKPFASEDIKVRAVLVGKWKQNHKIVWATDDRTIALRMILDKNRGSASKPGSFTPLIESPASAQEAGRVQTLWRRNIMALGCYSEYTGAKGDVRPQCILPF